MNTQLAVFRQALKAPEVLLDGRNTQSQETEEKYTVRDHPSVTSPGHQPSLFLSEHQVKLPLILRLYVQTVPSAALLMFPRQYRGTVKLIPNTQRLQAAG